ncbi:monocarboxylate transporter 9-like [Odontomachus brunneus]|uniref:monocarboxylate transporter 9-like n=1 Tax=Odontomachus brunneus TaxID=486640 RepID=UPI0013F1A36B|nr:monocarboxylate transporter 9-like [Odontomachus brunneus]XP_032664415.1 monocarboxylate transporter 9-like [Odontomachus brunneus]XP_032664416.1 monocarboxylate transporter 9-like [Odontomachus brunneus]
MGVTKFSGTTMDRLTDTTEKIVEKKSACIKIDEVTSEEDKITLEDLAPDGGWGWMIALAMILIIITTIGPSSSFAIIFGDFLEESGMAGMASSLFNSVFMITYSISSMMTNMFLKRYSVRSVGIMGALFFAIPDIILAFVRNIYEMAFLFFLQGFGLGLILTICNTVFNAYFVKKRAKVMSASQVVIALGGIIYPMLTEKMMMSYGFRGTAAIMGALSLNSVVGMTLMHPVEWHARKPKEVLAERARARQEKYREHYLALSKRRSTIDVIYASSKARWSSLRSLKEENCKEMSLLIENLKTPAHRVASHPTIEGEIRGRSGSIRESLTKGISTLSTSSLANLASDVSALSDMRQRHLEKKNKKRQWETDFQEKTKNEKQDVFEEKQEEEVQTECKTILNELVDMSLVKNCCFLNLCFGVSFVCTADYAFSSLLPLMMTDAGYTKADGARTVTLSGTTELISKVLLAVFTLIVNVQSKYMFFVAMILMEFARIGFLLCEHTLTGALIMIAIIGVVRPWLLVPQPLVIIEDISIKKLASAYGISAVIAGLVTVIFGALVGFIKDWTNSYKMYQISLLVMNGVFIVPWAVQFVLVEKRRRQRATTKNSLPTV